MSNEASQAMWTTEDETTLLEFLFQHRASAGDGSSFKMTTFHGAVPVLEATRTKGGPKTAKSCQNKWAMVCRLLFYLLSQFLTTFQLRRIWRTIQDIKSQSGWTWSNTHGANISPDMENHWATFLKSHPLAKPFKNHGWIHLDQITLIMPATLRGTHVYLPSQGTTGLAAAAAAAATPSAPAVADDESQEDNEYDDTLSAPVCTIIFLVSFPLLTMFQAATGIPSPQQGPSRRVINDDSFDVSLTYTCYILYMLISIDDFFYPYFPQTRTRWHSCILYPSTKEGQGFWWP
jgi:hypothetical protein